MPDALGCAKNWRIDPEPPPRSPQARPARVDPALRASPSLRYSWYGEDKEPMAKSVARLKVVRRYAQSRLYDLDAKQYV